MYSYHSQNNNGGDLMITGDSAPTVTTTLDWRDNEASTVSEQSPASPMLEADNDPYESVPDVLDSTSVKSEDDFSEDEDDDVFDPESVPMPRLSSSTIPIVLEVVPPSNAGRYASEDPLFQGVCLYHHVSPEQSTASRSTPKQASVRSREAPHEKQLTNSWFFPSIFQHLLDMQQQRMR